MGIVIIASAIVSLISHLGLLQVIGKVCSKVFSCTKCATFWLTIFYCLYEQEYSFSKAFCISVAASYLSLWIEMFYVWLNKKYNTLWEQILK